MGLFQAPLLSDFCWPPSRTCSGRLPVPWACHSCPVLAHIHGPGGVSDSPSPLWVSFLPSSCEVFPHTCASGSCVPLSRVSCPAGALQEFAHRGGHCSQALRPLHLVMSPLACSPGLPRGKRSSLRALVGRRFCRSSGAPAGDPRTGMPVQPAWGGVTGGPCW